MGDISNPGGGADKNTLKQLPAFSLTYGLRVSGSVAQTIGNWTTQEVGSNQVVQSDPTLGGPIDTWGSFRRYYQSAGNPNTQGGIRNSSTGGPALYGSISGARKIPASYSCVWGMTSRYSQFKANGRYFCGVGPGPTFDITGTFNDLQNCFGIAKDDADANFSWIHNDNVGQITKVVIPQLPFVDTDNNAYLALIGSNLNGKMCGILADILTLDVISIYESSVNLPQVDVPIVFNGLAGTGTTAGASCILVANAQFFANLYPTDLLA